MARKITGGKFVENRKKKLSERPGKPRLTVLGKRKSKEVKVRGGRIKTVLLSEDTAVVLDPKTKQSSKVKIKGVVKTPANRYFKNIIVKGTLIETEKGLARVTNRPGQEGSVSAVLAEEAK